MKRIAFGPNPVLLKGKREFDGIHKLFDDYRDSLRKAYVTPNVPDPK
jgi:hypothetical protein